MCKNKTVHKMATKIVRDIFDCIIDQDFNPDEIHIGLYESYEEGMKRGMLIGFGTLGMLVAAGYLMKIIKKKRKKEVTNEKDIPETEG